MQTTEPPALAGSPLTNTIQTAQFSPHHNLLSAHPNLLLLFSTILTGEPVQDLCFPFSFSFPQQLQKGGCGFYSPAVSGALERVAL